MAVILVKDGSGLDLGHSTGEDGEWSESAYTAKGEQMMFANGLDVGCRMRERKRERSPR